MPRIERIISEISARIAELSTRSASESPRESTEIIPVVDAVAQQYIAEVVHHQLQVAMDKMQQDESIVNEPVMQVPLQPFRYEESKRVEDAPIYSGQNSKNTDANCESQQNIISIIQSSSATIIAAGQSSKVTKVPEGISKLGTAPLVKAPNRTSYQRTNKASVYCVNAGRSKKSAIGLSSDNVNRVNKDIKTDWKDRMYKCEQLNKMRTSNSRAIKNSR